MGNVKKSKKALKVKEIEYGSTKKKYIDKSLEETLKKSGFERKPKPQKPAFTRWPKELPKEIAVPRRVLIDPDAVKLKLPRNIDREIEIKPEKKVKKIVVKEERQMVDLPSHLEFEAPETIQVKTGMGRIIQDTEGAQYGDLPEEIDIVHEETQEEKKKNKKSFFDAIKQTFGFNDDEEEEESQEDLERKKEELKREIEKKEILETEPTENLGNALRNRETIEEISATQYKTSAQKIQEEEPIIKEEHIPSIIKKEEIIHPIEREEIKNTPITPRQEYVKPQEKKEQKHSSIFEKMHFIKTTPKIEEKNEEKKEETLSDIDEMGLEPIKFTDKKLPEERKYEGIGPQAKTSNNNSEVLDNEEPDEDSSMDIMYSKPKKKSPYY